MPIIEARESESVVESASEDSAESKRSPIGWVLSTYFAEGLPFSIVHQLSAQFFTYLGASLQMVGATSLYGLAWNAKFLWSPLVDRFGTARRWLIGVEVVLALLVALLAWPAGNGDVSTVATGLVVVSVAAATHDIAVDGFYLRALGKRHQAQLSGVRVAAYRGALLFGNGLLVMLAGKTSWRFAFLVAAGVLLALAVFHSRALPQVAPPPAAVARPSAIAAVSAFFRQPGIGWSLPFILLFKAGDALMFAMSAPFIKSLGFAITGSGSVSGAGTIASILGTVIGGSLIASRGLSKTLFPIAVAQSVAILLYVAVAVALPPSSMVVAVVVVEQFIAGFGNAALLVFLMQRCVGENKAAHFAFVSAVMSVAMTTAGVLSGMLAARFGYPTFFSIAFACSTPGVVLSRWVPKEAAPKAATKLPSNA